MGPHVSWMEMAGSPRSSAACTPRSRSNTSHSLETESLFPGRRSMIDLITPLPGLAASSATADGTSSSGSGGNPFRNAVHLAILHDSTNTLRALLRFGLDPNRSGEAPTPPRPGLEQPSPLPSPIETAMEAARQAKSRKGSAARKASASMNNELTPYWKNDVSPISADLSSAVSADALQVDFVGVQRKSSSANCKVSTVALVGSINGSPGGVGVMGTLNAIASATGQEVSANNGARKISTRLSPLSFELSSPSASGTGTSSGERETSSAAHQALLATPGSAGPQGPDSVGTGISPNEQSTLSLPSRKLSPSLLSPFSVFSTSSTPGSGGVGGVGHGAGSAGAPGGTSPSARKMSGSTSAMLLSLLSPTASSLSTNRSPSVGAYEPKTPTGGASGGERRKVSTGTLQPILKPPTQSQAAPISDSAGAAIAMASARQADTPTKQSAAGMRAGAVCGMSPLSTGPGTGTGSTSESGSATPGTTRKFHLNLQPQYLPYPSQQSQLPSRKNSSCMQTTGSSTGVAGFLKGVLSSASLKSAPSTCDSAPSAVSCGSGGGLHLVAGLQAGPQAHLPPQVLLQQAIIQTLQTIAHYSLSQLFTQPPIFLAVHMNRVEALRLLLRYRASHRITDACGLTPLHVSAAKQRVGLECSQLLIEAGARVYVFSSAHVRPVDLFAQLRVEQEHLVAQMASSVCTGQLFNASSEGHTSSTSKTGHSSSHSVATTGTGTGTDTAEAISASASTSGSQRRKKSRGKSRGRGMSLPTDRGKSHKGHKGKSAKTSISKSPAGKRTLHDLTTLKNAKSLMRLTGSNKTHQIEAASISKEKKCERVKRKLSTGSNSTALPRPSLGASAGTILVSYSYGYSCSKLEIVWLA